MYHLEISIASPLFLDEWWNVSSYEITQVPPINSLDYTVLSHGTRHCHQILLEVFASQTFGGKILNTSNVIQIERD
jgi:hypothetical protein